MHRRNPATVGGERAEQKSHNGRDGGRDRGVVGAGRRRDVRGRRRRPPAGRRRGDGRGRVQHRARRLPGDPHRSVVRGTDHHVHVPAHRQLRRQRARRRSARAALPRRDRARSRAPAVELARDRRPRRLPRPPRGRGHRRASTRAASPATSAAPGAIPGAFGTADRDTLLAAAQADGGTDGSDLASVVTTPEPYTVGPDDATLYVVAYDFGIKRSILDQLVGAGCQVEVVPGGHERRRRARARARRRVPLERSRRSRRRSPAARTSVQAAARQRARVRHLPRAPDHEPRPRRARRSSCASATTAATTRCATSPTGRVEITSQNHNYAVDATTLPGRQRGHAPEPQRRRRRRGAQRASSARSACSTTPRRARVRTTRATCSRSSRN